MSRFLFKTKLCLFVVAVLGILSFGCITTLYKSIPHTEMYRTNLFETWRTGVSINSFTSRNWEELTLNDPVLEDWRSCADSESSVIYISEKKPSYKVGDVVTVDITLQDFLGRRKGKGGDMIRFLVKDDVNGARSTGYVVDKHDGTYKGVVKLLWAGNITISARVIAPRELIRLIYHNVRTGRIKRRMQGLFRRGSDVIYPDCTPYEDVASHYEESCNLTQRNADLPWYCEKPSNYSCTDWAESYFLKCNVSFTSQEQHMIQRISKRLAMKTAISLKVTNASTPEVPFPPRIKGSDNLVTCNKLLAKNTWTAKSPVGYLYRGKWYSTQCKNTFNGSVESFQTCLQGRKLWLLGDSNMRMMTSYFIEILGLNISTEIWTNKKWHKPSLASNKKANVSVFWGIHALPRFFKVPMVKATHQYIDDISANSKDYVIVHFYLHFLPFHPSLVRKHIRKTAQSIKAMKTRAPEVKVVVRGSHSFFDRNDITHLNDFWGIIYDKILKEEFASLKDDVIFLDMWDLTVATESKLYHPDETLMKYATNYMMALLCL